MTENDPQQDLEWRPCQRKTEPLLLKKRKKIRKIWIMETLSKDANFKPLSLLTQKPTVDKYIILKIVYGREFKFSSLFKPWFIIRSNGYHTDKKLLIKNMNSIKYGWYNIAKLSPSSSPRWAKLALFSLDPPTTPSGKVCWKNRIAEARWNKLIDWLSL